MVKMVEIESYENKINSRVLFCNIAYMKYYDGDIINDQPVNGGEYVAKNGDALEKYNFHPENDGYYYGFVETKYTDGYENAKSPKQIHIEKIDSSYKGEDLIDNVTVVFCAKSNREGKTVVVGWYKNATVYKERQNDINRQYNIKAKVEDCFLVPEYNRQFVVPRATKSENGIGFGQANIWFAAGNQEAKQFATKVIDYIDNYSQAIYIDASKLEKHYSIYKTLNKYFGTNYGEYQRAVWPSENGNGQFRVWFPKLDNSINGKVLATSDDCVNTLSNAWEEIIFDDLKELENENNKKYRYDGLTLVFAKEPNNGPYIFRGVYVQDKEKTSLNHIVLKRVATKVKVIGAPATRVELLDEIKVEIPLDVEEQEKQAILMSDNDLFVIAKKMTNKSPKKNAVSNISQFERSPYIAESAKRRAKGICQLCRKPAPFCKNDGSPYLESHHIVWLSEGGEDSVDNTVALCPNCHRKVHIVKSKEDVEILKKRNAESMILKDDTVINREVYHKKYGIGTVLELENNSIKIIFGNEEKLFDYNKCIELKAFEFI